MNIADFLPDIYLEAQGCPEDVALNALRHALREFCERTHAWQEEIDPIALSAGVRAYPIDPPPGAELVVVMRARYDAIQIPIYTPIDMDDQFPLWKTIVGGVVVAVVVEKSSVSVYPTPAENDARTLNLRAALRPSMNADTVPDELDRWREGIASGALARLKIVGGVPWSDREGAPVYRARFINSIYDARGTVLSGSSSGGMETGVFA